MDLPKISDLNVSGKRVLLRLDLDTEPDPNDLRIKASGETLDYLKGKGAEIIILGHKGRPTSAEASAGKFEFSLKPFQPIFDKWGAKVEENLRFDPGEKANDPEFAKKLASHGRCLCQRSICLIPQRAGFNRWIPKIFTPRCGI